MTSRPKRPTLPPQAFLGLAQAVYAAGGPVTGARPLGSFCTILGLLLLPQTVASGDAFTVRRSPHAGVRRRGPTHSLGQEAVDLRGLRAVLALGDRIGGRR